MKDIKQSMPRAARIFVRMLEKIDLGSLQLVFPDGSSQDFSGSKNGTHATLQLYDIGVCEALLARGDIGFGETYMSGLWTSPDIAKLINLAVENRTQLSSLIGGNALIVAWYRLKHLLRRNTKAGSRKNILAHYDLGNEFYRRWLDPSMTYSAALFEQDDTRTLQQAQHRKYQRIADNLGILSDSHILEIGCGWGGFAETAIGQYGATLDGVTLSPSQLSYAEARLESKALHHRAKLTLTDYRDIQGHYDYIVSIEMFEAVGEQYWTTYFSTLKRLLKPTGKAMVQTITIANEQFHSYRTGTDFIQQYIFPGGMLPSVDKFTQLATQAELRVVNAHPFGCDYAKTLQIWRTHFEEKWNEIRPLGFDERFRRLWVFYLAYCEGSFLAGSTNVYQFELAHA